MNQLDKENLHKEIDLIQACITRMANNSFLVKGWTISIIVVGLALVDKKINPIILCSISLIPLISFWWLDAFFLYTEKLYRELYKWVISERIKNNSKNMYDLNPHRFKNQLYKKKEGGTSDKLETQFSVMWSKTLWPFYLIPTLMIIGISTWLHFYDSNKDETQKVEIVNVVNANLTDSKSNTDSIPQQFERKNNTDKIKVDSVKPNSNSSQLKSDSTKKPTESD